MRIPISAVIIAKNEAENLPDCLATVAWADEVLVVDSFSTDNTVTVATAAGARVAQHAFRDYADQRNFAQAQARNDWVLFIDADERVSQGLRDEINRLADTGELAQCHAYHIQRLHLFSGRWLFSDPTTRRVTAGLRKRIREVEVPRMIDRRVARWERPLHETVQAPLPHGVLDGVIYHYAGTNLSAAGQSLNAYTDREAAYLQATLGRTRVSLVEAVARGIRAWAFQYCWQGWWRLGEQGFMMAVMNGYTKFITYAKLGELLRIQRNQGIWTAQDRDLAARDRSEGEGAGPIHRSLP